MYEVVGRCYACSRNPAQQCFSPKQEADVAHCAAEIGKCMFQGDA